MVLSYDDRNEEIELPEDFEPSSHDAIVGWARQNYHHLGNQKLRDVVYRNVPQYLNAQSKTEKGRVIASIIAQIRLESPTGTGLVRQSPKTLRWSYIGLDKAKDKIGHALRKASQEYERKQARHKSYNSPYNALPHSTSSSSLLDSTTTATPSMSSSESDNEEENMEARHHYRAHSSGGYNYQGASSVAGSYPHPGYQSSSSAMMYNYPAPSTQHMMFYHPSAEVATHQHAMAYPVYSGDPLAAASSYHHHHPFYYSHRDFHYQQSGGYQYAYHHYDPHHSPKELEYYHVPEEPVTHSVPSYPEHSVATPSRSCHSTISPTGSSNNVPILPKQEYSSNRDGPDPWARAIQDVILP